MHHSISQWQWSLECCEIHEVSEEFVICAIVTILNIEKKSIWMVHWKKERQKLYYAENYFANHSYPPFEQGGQII